MRVIVSTAIVIPFTFEDDYGVLVTGKVNGDFVKSAYLTTAPATTVTPTIAATSGQSGDYGVTLTPTATGQWRVNWSCVIAGDRTYRFTRDVEVVTAAQFDPVATLAAQTITISSPVTSTGAMTLVKGDDYLHADSRAISWDVTGVPSLVGATVTFIVIRAGVVRLTKVMTVVDLDTARLELTDTETGTLKVGGAYSYKVNALIGASDILLASGSLTVT